MPIDSSTLTLFPSLAGGSGDGLLSLLYPSGGSGSVAGDPLQALQSAEKGKTADVARTAADPQVKRDLDAFSKAVAKAKTPADLLTNPQFLKVLLTANGLGDQTAYAALARKALLSDPSQPKALVNQLADAR